MSIALRPSSSSGNSSHLPFKPPPPSRKSFGEYLNRRPDPGLQNQVQRQIVESIDSSKCSFRRFPGPLPASVSRSVLQILSQELFWVTEKSDGERFMLWISAHGSFLINRKFSVIRIVAPIYTEIFQKSLPILLDGEIMESDDWHSMYLAYDCLRVGDENLTCRAFSARIEAIESLTQRFEAVAAQLSVPLDFPFRIVSKLFVKHVEINRIFGKIHHHSRNGYMYIDPGRQRSNKNDGLIFVADRDSYLPERTTSLLKWKWPDKNTIDFRFKKPFVGNQGEIEFYCGGYGKESDLCVRRVVPTGNMLQQLEEWCGGGHSVIAECFYDASTGQWKLCNNRPDKHRPNHVLTVIQTMESMIDNITKDDLRKACGRFREKR